MKSPHAMTREELEEEVVYLREEVSATYDIAQFDFLRKLGLRAGPARMLLALRRAAPRAMTKTQLLEIGQHPHGEPLLKMVDVYISHIRKLVGFEGIETVWGHGYFMTTIGVRAMDALGLPNPVSGLKVTALQRVGRGGRSA